MRRDLLRALLLMALGAALVLGLPLGLAGSVAFRARARQGQAVVTETILAAVAQDLEDGTPPDSVRLASYTPPGYGAELLDQQGAVVAADGTPPPGRDHQAPIGGYTVVVWSTHGIGADLALVWGVVAVATASTGVLAWLIGARVSRRLTDPLDQLAAVAAQIAQGDLAARAPRSAVPEVDRIGTTLNASTARLGQLIARERQFSANVAHQLRTPITGLLFRLDAAAQAETAEDVHRELAAAVVQTERLADIVELLLNAASSQRQAPTGTVDLARVVGGHLADWRHRFERAGRPLESHIGGPVWVEAADSLVEQVLDVLLDNALAHGAGTVTVRVEPRGRRAVVRVDDEGRSLGPEASSLIFQRGWSRRDGPGLGLEVARALTEQSGGRLELVSRTPTGFEVILPLVRPGGDGTRDDGAPANYDRAVPPTAPPPVPPDAPSPAPATPASQP